MEVAELIPVPITEAGIGTLRVPIRDDDPLLAGALTASAGVIADFEDVYLTELTHVVETALKTIRRTVTARLRAQAKTGGEFSLQVFANPWHDERGRFAPKGTGKRSGPRLKLKSADRNMSQASVVKAMQKVANDVAAFYGATPGETKHDAGPYSTPGEIMVDEAVETARALDNGVIMVNPAFADRAGSNEYGVHDLRVIAHEAIHMYVSGSPRVYADTIGKTVEEGAAELLSINYWNKRGQPYDARDATRRPDDWPGDTRWTSTPAQHLAASVVYPEYVIETARRAASSVGGWDDRDAVFAEVEAAMRADHDGRIAFRDGTDPNFPLPDGVAHADVETEAANLVLHLIEDRANFTIQFANPWHDEIGRFAPKGTGRRFGPKALNEKMTYDQVDLGDIDALKASWEQFADDTERKLARLLPDEGLTVEVANAEKLNPESTDFSAVEFVVKRNGEQVATMVRHVDPDEGSIHAAELTIADDMQGRGIGTVMQEGFEDWAASQGIDHVTVKATKIGRYTWMRAGYDWDDRATLDLVASAVRKHAETEQGAIRQRLLDAADKFTAAVRDVSGGWKSEDLPTPYELSQILPREVIISDRFPTWKGIKPLRTSRALAAAANVSRFHVAHRSTVTSGDEADREPTVLPVRPAEGDETRPVLRRLPRGVHEGMASNASPEHGAASQGHSPVVRERVQTPGETDPAAVRELRLGEGRDAPSGLHAAAMGDLAVPGVPSAGASRRVGEGASSDAGSTPSTVNGREARLEAVRDAWEQWWPQFPAAADGADDPEAEAAWEQLMAGGLVAAGPFDLSDFNVMTPEDWAAAFDVEAADIVGDVVVDAATGQPLRAGLNVTDKTITDLIDRHVNRLTSLGPVVQASIRDSLRLAVEQQLTLTEVIREMQATGPLGETAARAIARTELTAATNGGMLVGWQRDGFPFKRWVSLHDGLTRHSHLDADGQVVPTEQEFEVGSSRAMYPGDPRLPVGERINCFPAGTPVSGAIVRAGLRRWYDGPLVRIRLLSGEITGTPNHPVLTERGWVALGEVAPSDRLVRCTFNEDRSGRGEPHEQREPSLIEEVVASLNSCGLVERMSRMAVDLHGERPDSDVDVVTADSLLWLHGASPDAQPADHFDFALADMSAGALSGGRPIGGNLWRLGPTPSSVGGAGQPTSLGRIRSGHPDHHGLAATPGEDPRLVETSPNHPPGDPQALGQSLLGLAAEVSLDQILNIEIEPFHGDVFTLDTISGWYIAGSGYVARNCRCYMDRVGQNGATIDTRLVDMTRAQLYRLAQELNIPGRARMRKPELFAAIDRYRSGFGYQSLEEMTLAQLMIRARAAGIVGRSTMRKPELMVRLRERARGRTRERWLLDAGHGTPEQLQAAQAQLQADIAAVLGQGGLTAAANIPAATVAQIQADVFRRYGGDETGTILCVGCGARLHWSASTRWEQMTLIRINPNLVWSSRNAMPVCLADAAKLVKRRWSVLTIDFNHWSMWQTQFANPWHDEIGRFAPKGTGRKFGPGEARPLSDKATEILDAIRKHANDLNKDWPVRLLTDPVDTTALDAASDADAALAAAIDIRNQIAANIPTDKSNREIQLGSMDDKIAKLTGEIARSGAGFEIPEADPPAWDDPGPDLVLPSDYSPDQAAADMAAYVELATLAGTGVRLSDRQTAGLRQMLLDQGGAGAIIAAGADAWTGRRNRIMDLRKAYAEGDPAATEFFRLVQEVAPPSDRPLYRGLAPTKAVWEQFSSLKPGDEIPLWGASSFSGDEGTARERFAQEDGVVIKLVPGAPALPISAISRSSGENEYLVGQRLRVISVRKVPGVRFDSDGDPVDTEGLEVTVEAIGPTAPEDVHIGLPPGWFKDGN